MKLKLFTNRDIQVLEFYVNEWLEGRRSMIKVDHSQLSQSSIINRSGSIIVHYTIAIYYREEKEHDQEEH